MSAPGLRLASLDRGATLILIGDTATLEGLRDVLRLGGASCPAVGHLVDGNKAMIVHVAPARRGHPFRTEALIRTAAAYQGSRAEGLEHGEALRSVAEANRVTVDGVDRPHTITPDAVKMRLRRVQAIRRAIAALLA